MRKKSDQNARCGGRSKPFGPGACLAHALVASALVGACAASPEAIAPTPVSGVRYQSLECAQLGRELSALDEKIAVLSTKQRTRRVNDAVGWVYVLMPTASLTTADIRPQIALHKGEREAVERAMASRCNTFLF